jgi:hypothetical protein
MKYSSLLIGLTALSLSAIGAPAEKSAIPSDNDVYVNAELSTLNGDALGTNFKNWDAGYKVGVKDIYKKMLILGLNVTLLDNHVIGYEYYGGLTYNIRPVNVYSILKYVQNTSTNGAVDYNTNIQYIIGTSMDVLNKNGKVTTVYGEITNVFDESKDFTMGVTEQFNPTVSISGYFGFNPNNKSDDFGIDFNYKLDL